MSTGKHFCIFVTIVSLFGNVNGVFYNNKTIFIKSNVNIDSVDKVDFNCSIVNLGSVFNITRFSSFTTKQHSDITKAHCVWETVLLGRDVDSHQGLTINFSLVDIDGVGGILGSAGWRTGDYYNSLDNSKTYAMALTGEMSLDIADVNSMSLTDAFFYVVVHEIGHILGIGTLWELNNVYNDSSGKYTGCYGINAFNSLYQKDFGYVPVELDGGDGTANAHWDEETISDVVGRSMKEELMTGYLATHNYLTKLTSNSLKDIGFITNPKICGTDFECSTNLCNRGFIDTCDNNKLAKSQICYSKNSSNMYKLNIMLLGILVLILIIL